MQLSLLREDYRAILYLLGSWPCQASGLMGQLEKRGFSLSRTRGKIMVDVNADESVGRKESS